MTRSETIKRAADELFKDSGYPVPDTCSFVKGAEWADNNPESPWKEMKEDKPEKDQVIVLAIINIQFKGAEYRIVRYDPYVFPVASPHVFWMPVPDLPDCLLKPLFGID